MHSRPQKISLIFADARSKFDTDLELNHDENAIRNHCYGRGRTCDGASGVETLRRHQDRHREPENILQTGSGESFSTTRCCSGTLALNTSASPTGAPLQYVTAFDIVACGPPAACREKTGSNFSNFNGGTAMGNNLRSTCDAILQKVATGKDRVPGVVAMITDRWANIYEGAAGERMLGAGQAMTTDTVFAIYSTTKAITGTAALQCVEEGKLDLDAPAKTYVPDIGKLEVLEGFDAAGKPKLRAPKRDITTRMLMLHTAGLGYDFFNANYLRLAQEHGQPSVITCSKASLMTPLLFDPGDKWEYGSNIDWCGQVVERIRGKRLGGGMKERVFGRVGWEV